MFERYTEHARRALFFARYEASQLGSALIKPEHLVLGILREGDPLTRQILVRAGVSLEGIRDAVTARSAEPDTWSLSSALRRLAGRHGELPFTADTKSALQYGADEADRLSHARIGPEHLLLGVLRTGPSAIASLLAEHGLRLEQVRETVDGSGGPGQT